MGIPRPELPTIVVLQDEDVELIGDADTEPPTPRPTLPAPPDYEALARWSDRVIAGAPTSEPPRLSHIRKKPRKP